MDLDTVEPCVTCGADRVSEETGDLLYLVLFQTPAESRGIQVESCGGSYRCASGGGTVGHIAAMSQLDGCLCTCLVDSVGDLTEFGNNLGPQPELGGERESGATYSRVGESRHSDASPCDGKMVVAKHVGGAVVTTHSLESCRTYGAVAEFYGADFRRCE